MQLKSPAFPHGGKIPPLYTCNGKDLRPELHISEVQAKSLVLIMDDPDVPPSVRQDRMWVHFVLFNIPPQTTLLPPEGTLPGIVGMNTQGLLGYQGPCPPDREHRYFFKLYALDTLLDLPEGSSKQQVEKAMQGHVIVSSELMGRYTAVNSKFGF
jgi:Raf kinase inhibitor-like YbhB/YbcL family protein